MNEEVCVDVLEVVQKELLVAAMVEDPDDKEVIQMVVGLVEEVAVGVCAIVLVAVLADKTEEVVVDKSKEAEKEIVNESVDEEEIIMVGK